MENKTYIVIGFTYYSRSSIPPMVWYFRAEPGQACVKQQEKLDIDTAKRMMWELVKQGGKATYRTNMFNNGICTREVTFYGRL